MSCDPTDRATATARLAPHTLKNTRANTLAGLKCWARLVGAHDGDTVTVIAEIAPERFAKLILRLHGIDTCEMTSTDSKLKAAAICARNRVIELLTSLHLEDGRSYKRTEIEALLEHQVYTVWVECVGEDKYGRVLAHVRPAPQALSVSDTLVAEHLAFKYDGGTKLSSAAMQTGLDA